MGMPNIPDISPTINLRDNDVINLLLASIALEEFSLAAIMNAEAEKIQELLGSRNCPSLQDMITLDKSVERILRDVIKKEILLEFKFENVLDLLEARG
ncbi:hypothetical protein [Caloramator australicus]|uniref:Uncharacterized protein n=1 Tax=Caloramator australicus RC3 TaxID=857293 RepID=I7LI89_9CLOT|nr:hypothetical protein [Caloramator australicus]CCJ32757.1 hypothetical protein CAAU_0673 [Caloramator australicus RC3]